MRTETGTRTTPGRQRPCGRATRLDQRLALALAGSTLAVALLLLGMPRAHAATYKWVDEKGVVHYTDKLPPEEVNRATVELDKQGITVKKTEPALTPEQRRARAEEGERQKEQAKRQEESARRDRALLASYTNESEIDLARNRSLRTIDSVLKSAQAYSEQLAKRQAALEAQKKTEYSDKPFPPALERELEGIKLELARQSELIALKQSETVAVNAKYDADKQRWRNLVAAKGGEAATAGAGGGASKASAPYPGGETKK